MHGLTYTSTVPGKAAIKALSIILLCAATFILFNMEERYRVVATNILQNLDFSKDGEHWFATRGVTLSEQKPRVLVLRNRPGGQAVVAQGLRPPANFRYIRVGVDIALDHVVAGPLWWQRVGVVMYSFDKRRYRLGYWPAQVAMAEGSGDWRHFQEVIPIAPNAARMELILFTGAESGAAAFRNLTVDGLTNAAWFLPARFALIGAWIAAVLWIVLPLLIRHRRNRTACLAFLVFAALLTGMLMPQPELSIIADQARHAFDSAAAPLIRYASRKPAPDHAAPAKTKQETARKPEEKKETKAPKQAEEPQHRPGTPNENGASARIAAAMPQALTEGGGASAAHFILYTILALLIPLAFRDTSRYRLLAYLLLTGASTEIAQYFIVTRDVSLSDGEMNAGGIATGFAVALLWLLLTRKPPAATSHIPEGGSAP